MPTVIAIDSSLSMSRIVAPGESKLQLSCAYVAAMVDHLSRFKLEHVAVLSFSSSVDTICDFTRNYDDVKASLNKVKVRDRCSFPTLVQHIDEVVVRLWGCIEPCNVVVFTDGRMSTHLETDCNPSSDLFRFPATIYFLCLETLPTLKATGCYDALDHFVRYNNDIGSIIALFKPHLSGKELISCARATVNDFLDREFSVFTTKLCCGSLSSKMVIFPSPKFPKDLTFKLDDELHVVGFLSISDVGNPAVLSRHLLLPVDEEGDADKVKGHQPAFSVLLHGSLKTENKVAFVKLACDWYGIAYSWSDNKVKFNLALSILTRGTDAAPWLGDLNRLGPASFFVPSAASKSSSDLPTFPVLPKKGAKRSYAQPTVAWIRATGLQTDVQKILRSAKKLPEKSQVFYKDLNRLRRAALSFGFHELLEGIVLLLERECTLLPGTAHPEATLQLSHAARELKSSISLDYNHQLEPLKTDFKFNR